MRDLLGFVFAFICAFSGALLLYNGTQTLSIVGGAVLMSLALETLWLVIKARLEWREKTPGQPTSHESAFR